MRLFIAINFNSGVKANLSEIIDRLKTSSITGRYTLRENLHLTLVFLGEVESGNVPAVQAAMERVRSGPFQLSLGGLGCFKRRGGDIYWIGIDSDKQLQEIYRQLWDRLTDSGFVLENRPFKPHLTIGRQVDIRPDFDPEEFNARTPPMKTDVNKIALMKSEHIQGKLVYTEIYAVEL